MRVWDRFLSDQDRRLLASDRPPPSVREGRRPALLLVDFWASTLGDAPLPILDAVKQWPRSMGEPAWRAVEQTKRLLAAARSSGIPVIHTTTARGRYAPKDWFSATREIGDITRHLGVEDPFAIVPELRPIDGEVLIEKIAASAFFGTPLVSVLQEHAVDSLVVCGESTSGCVRASVVDAASYGFRTFVVEDCVYDRTEATHAINLFDMDQKYARVLDVEEVLRWWH